MEVNSEAYSEMQQLYQKEKAKSEEMSEALLGATYMMTGMLLDQSIHDDAKSALANKADELSSLIAKYT